MEESEPVCAITLGNVHRKQNLNFLLAATPYLGSTQRVILLKFIRSASPLHCPFTISSLFAPHIAFIKLELIFLQRGRLVSVYCKKLLCRKHLLVWDSYSVRKIEQSNDIAFVRCQGMVHIPFLFASMLRIHTSIFPLLLKSLTTSTRLSFVQDGVPPVTSKSPCLTNLSFMLVDVVLSLKRIQSTRNGFTSLNL